MSYFEHPSYVPLLRSAYQLWDELSSQRGEQLFHRTGLIYFGTPDSIVVNGIKASAREHDLAIETLEATEAARRYPAYVAPEGATTLHERDAGYLRVEDCVRAHIAEALAAGAEHRHGETILSWSAIDAGVTVTTDRGKYEAAKLVITAGCWTRDLLANLNIPLRVLRKHQHWYSIDEHRFREASGCPSFFFEFDGGLFYGFPDIDGGGLKVAARNRWGTPLLIKGSALKRLHVVFSLQRK